MVIDCAEGYVPPGVLKAGVDTFARVITEVALAGSEAGIPAFTAMAFIVVFVAMDIAALL